MFCFGLFRQLGLKDGLKFEIWEIVGNVGESPDQKNKSC